MTRAAQWQTILDSELVAVRARYAVTLAAEHARMTAARQTAEDAAIVQAREARVLASRGKAIVRGLVEP